MRRLDIRNLSVSFAQAGGLLRAVKNVSLHVDEAETLALVGESGSGKTVTCRAVMGLLAENAVIERGAIFLNGRSILGLPEKTMRTIRGTEMAMIFQDPLSSLDPSMKIGAQLAEAVSPAFFTQRKKLRARCVELLSMVGLNGDDGHGILGRYPHEFSGGQCQRILTAMAIARGSGLIIADEPTASLDVTIQAQIIGLFKDLQRRLGTSILFVSHDLGVVARIADRAAVMYDGAIVETGSADEIFYAPRHEYTKSLLAAVPLPDPRRERARTFIG